MHGNVMEWCLDHYVEDAYVRFHKLPLLSGLTQSPVFMPTENKWSHVARGGHYKSEAKDFRSAARVGSHHEWMKADPENPQSIWWLANFDVVGFRVCCSVDDDRMKSIRSTVLPKDYSYFKPD
jgi:formylglycine-generating enzyme required for sulfatase activity